MDRAKKHKRPKDGLQSELAEELRKRREKGLTADVTSTEDEDDDDEDYDDGYEDDFEEEEVVPKPSMRKKESSKLGKTQREDEWLQSYLQDDSDDLAGGGSMFLKKPSNKTQKKDLFDPLGLTMKESRRPLGKQTAIFNEENSSGEEEDDNPLLSLLKSPKSEKQPVPTKRSGPGRSSGDGQMASEYKSSLDRMPQLQSSNRTRSPQHSTDKSLYSESEYQMKQSSVKSPRERVKSPTGRQSSKQDPHFSPNEHRSKSPTVRTKSPNSENYIDQNHQESYSRYERNRAMSPSDRHTPEKDGRRMQLPNSDARKSFEKKEHSSNPRQTLKSPKSGKESPVLQSILSTMKTDENAGPPTGSQHHTDKRKSSSIVDFILDDAPKPAPRRRGSRATSQDSQSQQDAPSRSLSPGSTKEQRSINAASSLERQRSTSGERMGRKSPSGRVSSPVSRSLETKEPFSLSTFNSHQSSTSGGLLTTKRGDVSGRQADVDMTRREKKQVESGADDLLALFNQAVKDEEPVDFQAHIQTKEKKMMTSPVDEVVQRTSDQKQNELVKQRSSQLLFDNVIANVAQYNEKDGLQRMEKGSPREDKDQQGKTPRPKSGKKSYRTPPVNYGGLGSLTALKELKKKDVSSPRSTESHNITTDDIRKQVYQEWLAKREEQTKKKKIEEEKKQKEENEKKNKEREEREMENLLVRKKWEEIKTDDEKKKFRVKRIQERHKEKEKEEKEKQKLKSEKQAEKRRKELLESGRIRHQAEMRKKREEERKKKKKVNEQKKLNEQAMNTWMRERSEKWVQDRKKEEKEIGKKRKEEKYLKEEATREAEETYKTWREKKDDQLRSTMREKKMKQRREKYGYDQDEENNLPPWSPCNKVIPKQR